MTSAQDAIRKMIDETQGIKAPDSINRTIVLSVDLTLYGITEDDGDFPTPGYLLARGIVGTLNGFRNYRVNDIRIDAFDEVMDTIPVGIETVEEALQEEVLILKERLARCEKELLLRDQQLDEAELINDDQALELANATSNAQEAENEAADAKARLIKEREESLRHTSEITRRYDKASNYYHEEWKAHRSHHDTEQELRDCRERQK